MGAPVLAPLAGPPSGPAPLDGELQRLAEILGALHYLRAVCGAKEGTKWRDQMEALLRDFFRTDAWSAVEGAHGPEVHLIQATESSILTPEAVNRIETAGLTSGRVHLHRVRGGHWLNADNPDALVELLVEGLPE